MRKSFIALSLALLVLSSGCAQPEQSKATRSNIKDPPSCTRKLEVAAELAIPGEISGFDCYDTDNNLEYLFRESHDQTILAMTKGTWISTPDSPLFILEGDGWFVLANKDNSLAMEAKGVVNKGAFVELVNNVETDDTDPAHYDSETCSQFASALIHAFAFEQEPLPENLSSEAREIIEDDYGVLTGDASFRALDPDSPDARIILGNNSQRINKFCAQGGEIFNGIG
ncbi:MULTISPECIES: hypothetical protein [unclassified Actinobaculum]|uniref:hypothetical protein n=1 Tax=unclassified Actinobaculum TaxID=2609299 RepID=UPI000D52A010|nr:MULTISPECIES: hypothetical protein [unclassified Actinobaculum]AWE42687.1 hypothetical protein DDD63_07920 [Actinobaculum sp. 313]RTE49494.1 hypothetical protein EKN07_05405 [Actinobaculum sp. 352]